MKSEFQLEWFEDLITTKLHPQQGPPLDEMQFQQLRQQIKSETGNVRKHILHYVFNSHHIQALELLIQQYQRSLIQLLDQLEITAKSCPGWPSEQFNLYPDVAGALQELLQFIETYFTKYFDLEQNVPASYLRLLQKNWRQHWKKNAAVFRKQVPEELYNLISTVLLSLLNRRNHSYGEMIYTKELLHLLGAAIPDSLTDDDLFTPLLPKLIYLNLNHSGMVSFAIRQMQAVLEGEKNDKDKTEKLNQYKIAVEENPIKPGVAYSKTLPSFSHSLLRWIEYQLHKLKSDFLYPEIQASMNKQTAEKINLSVSVAMFGLFIRLLREESIITNKNQAEMVRFFAEHFATLKQSEISAESLYGSYFKPQPGTVRMMQECLLQLQNTLHKKF